MMLRRVMTAGACAVAASAAGAQPASAAALRTQTVTNVIVEAGPPRAFVNYTYTATGSETKRLTVTQKGGVVTFATGCRSR